MTTSRKLIVAILAVVGAAGTVIGAEFGLALNVTGLVAFLGGAALYIQQEAKADKLRMAAQKAKWGDPKFLLTILSAVVAALPGAGVNLPLDPGVINAVLAVIVGILFKAKPSLPA